MKFTNYPDVKAETHEIEIDLKGKTIVLKFKAVPLLSYAFRLKQEVPGLDEMDEEMQGLLQGLVLLLISLEEGQVEFEAQREDFERPEDYYLACISELETIGIRPSHFNQIQTELLKGNDKLQDTATENFSDAVPDSSPNSPSASNEASAMDNGTANPRGKKRTGSLSTA